MGDLFARNLGLGHVAGLPFLAIALAIVIVAERFDRIKHQSYYWIAIIIVRTAATNFADFAAGDLKLPRVWVMAALLVLLVAALWLTWQFAWRQLASKTDNVLRADLGYWVCMFIAGTLGTVIGDFCSHNQRLDDGGVAVVLSPIVAVLLLVGWRGPLRLLPYYWLTVVTIRAAGTAVGDFVSSRNMLGLPVSTQPKRYPSGIDIATVEPVVCWPTRGSPAYTNVCVSQTNRWLCYPKPTTTSKFLNRSHSCDL
jgi:uncharacterized membrane-anchored protein